MESQSSSEEAVQDWYIRKNLIDYLELTSSFDEQNEYQTSVPFVHVPSEVLNQWEDWVRSPEDLSHRGPPVYTAVEIAALMRFGEIWAEVAVTTPKPLPVLSALQHDPNWLRLSEAATAALAAMMIRGRSPAECPIDLGA